MTHFRSLSIRVLAIAAALSGPAAAGDGWPQWGGPARDFSLAAEPALEAWPDGGPARLWKRDLGAGYSAIVTDGKRLYTMTRRADEEVVVALSPASGDTVWEHAYAAPVEESQSLDVSYGSGPNATPLLVRERLITLGFTGLLHALDAESGSVVWMHDLAAELEVQIPYFGHSASPMRFKDTVIVMAGGAHAFSLDTGELRWSNREFAASYASPILTRRGGRDLMIAAAAGEIVGLDPATGALLWRHEHANSPRTILSSPVRGNKGLVFVSAYFLGSIGLDLSAQGHSVAKRWENPSLQLSQNNSVRREDLLYGFHNSVFVALDLSSGRIAWRHRGYERANLILRGDRALLFDRHGKLSLVELGRDGPGLLAQTQLLEGRCWTVPTLVGNTLFVRNLETISAWDLTRAAPAQPPVVAARREPRSVRAPAAFVAAARELLGAYRRADVEALAAAASKLEPWREHPDLAPYALYYLGFGAYQRALLSTDGHGGLLLRQAERQLQSAIERDKTFADAHALLARLYPAYWRFDRGRAAVVGPLGDEHMSEALRYEPDNPRVVAIHGLNLFHSPPEYGGDPERGLAVLRRALESFARQPPPAADSAIPDWGHASAWLWYGELLERRPEDRDRARQAFAKALELAPDLSAARQALERLGASDGASERK